MGIRPTLQQRLRWQEFYVVLASARIGRFGELPTQENGPGVFSIVVRLVASQNIFGAMHRDLTYAERRESFLQQPGANRGAATGHALLPQH